MDNLPLINTALSDVKNIQGAQHTLKACPLVGKINLRGDVNNQSFIQGVELVLQINVALVANTWVHSKGCKVFWLGPDEWTIHLPLEQVDEILTSLHKQLSGVPHAVVDVSDYYSVISLSGSLARDILATAMSFDLRAKNFSYGGCAQSRFGHASVLFWLEDEAPSFNLQVRWSYAQYVYEYLAQSLNNIEKLSAFESNDTN